MLVLLIVKKRVHCDSPSVLGTTTPKALLNAAFFQWQDLYLLGEEDRSDYRSLKLSQLKHLNNPDYYIHTGNGSKTL